METLPESTLVELIRYNNWANQQVLQACQKLSEAQLETSMPGAYGSIRATLEHIIRGESGYLKLLTGNRPQPSFNWEDKPGLEKMSAYAAQVEDALENAVQHTLPTHQIEQEMEGKNLHYQALALFIQIIDHGVEHRTNITTILNAGQLMPPEVDGWGYLSAHPERFDYQER